MPEISRFLGIVIRIYRDEHPPPHFHAIYNEFTAQISIRPACIIQGKLPPRILGYVTEWANLHQDELVACWLAAQTDQPVSKIDPLV
jgi:hypothetical protein